MAKSNFNCAQMQSTATAAEAEAKAEMANTLH